MSPAENFTLHAKHEILSIILYITVAGDFTARLDEIAEKYQKMGICDGEECNQLRVQVQIISRLVIVLNLNICKRHFEGFCLLFC